MPRVYKLTPEGRESGQRKRAIMQQATLQNFVRKARIGPRNPNPVPIKTLAAECGLKYFKGKVW